MAFTTMSTAASTSPSPNVATATATPSTFPNPDPQSNLPDPTTWLIGLLLSWLAFGLVIAVMLLMAQFPETFPWWAEMTDVPLRRKKMERVRGVSSAVVHNDVDAGGFRLRKPSGLSVSTRQKRGVREGEGLGILLPTDGGEARKKVKKRVSFDPSTTTRKNPPCQSWEAATAPLPQTKAFLQTLKPADDSDSDCDDEILRCPDIETGHPMPNTLDLNDHYAERRASPYFKAEAGDREDDEDDEEAKKGSGWLGKVNKGVYRVADRMAVKFYDKVNGAEEGLLLPVREREREGWMGRVVD